MAICQVYREFDKQSVIDSETGIISWLAEIYPEPGQPEIFNYSTKMADTSKYLPTRCYDKNGGAALTRESAQLAAVGEAIERYCSSVFFVEDLVLGTITDVNKRERALRPDEITLFHPKQKDKIRYSWFTDNTKICWTEGYSITKKEPILIPACMTYIPYYPFLIEKGERTIAPSISTGQASACSYSDALLRGIYEIIERDAFMISWLNQLPIPKINIDSSSLIAQIFHERFERDHLQYTFYNMTTDLEVPSIFCLLIDQSRDPPLICTGGASNIDPEKAALKALVEVAQTYQWAIFLGKQGKPLIVESDYSNIDDFQKHVHLYAYGDMMDAIRFLTESPREISFTDLQKSDVQKDYEELSYVVSKIHSSGYEIMVVDLTSVDVKECGYCVLKVMIPMLQPMEGDHAHQLLGGKRIYEVPQKLGYSIKSDPDSLNPYPHPYP